MSSAPRIISDPHNILADMRANGSYITGNHVVYKYSTHGEEYLDKDAHLNHPESADKVAELLSRGITPGAIIIAPETSSGVNLAKRVAEITGNRCLETKKVLDSHTFNPEEITGHLGKFTLIGVDDIFNNGVTWSQIQLALGKFHLHLHQFKVMVDRNPQKSREMGIPLESLATLQIPQWDEKEVPESLKAKPINTKLGKARNWVPKSPGEVIAYKFFLERLHKQRLGFTFDDGMIVKQFDQDGFMLRPAESLAEIIEENQ